MYVLKSNVLDFSLDLRPNFYSFDPNATIKLHKKGIRMNDEMKWQILTIASDFGASYMNKQQHDTLFVAIIKTQSYLCGFKRPVIGIKYLQNIGSSIRPFQELIPQILNTYLVPKLLGNVLPT